MFNSILILDVAGAPIAIAGVGIVTVAVFFGLIFLIILLVRKIGKMDENKANKSDSQEEE